MLAELVFVFLVNWYIWCLAVLSILFYIDVLAFDGFSHFRVAEYIWRAGCASPVGSVPAGIVFVFLVNWYIWCLAVLSILFYIDVLAFDGFSHFRVAEYSLLVSVAQHTKQRVPPARRQRAQRLVGSEPGVKSSFSIVL